MTDSGYDFASRVFELLKEHKWRIYINVDKTKTKYIGTLMSCDHFPHWLSWIKTPIEMLGITITDNDEANFKHNFQ